MRRSTFWENLRENQSCDPHVPAIVLSLKTLLGTVPCCIIDESCLAASHLLGVLPCQILVIFPQHLDYDDNKYNDIIDEDKDHGYNEWPQQWTCHKTIALWNCQPAAVERQEMISEDQERYTYWFSMLLTLLMLIHLTEWQYPFTSCTLKMTFKIHPLEKWDVFVLPYFSMKDYGLVERKWAFESGSHEFKCHTLSLTRCLTLSKLLFCFIFECAAHSDGSKFKRYKSSQWDKIPSYNYL